MAGVLEQIRRPRKKLVGNNVPTSKTDPKVLQLQAAMEILAEVFGTDVSDVEEMLRQRYVGRIWAVGQRSSPDEGLWPREFCLDG